MDGRNSGTKNMSTFHKAKSRFTAVVQQEMQVLRARGLSNADAQAELCHRLDLPDEPIMAQKVDYMSRTFHLSIPAATLAAALQPGATAQLRGTASVSDVIDGFCSKLSTPKSPLPAAKASAASSSRSTDSSEMHQLGQVGGKKRRSEGGAAAEFPQDSASTCDESGIPSRPDKGDKGQDIPHAVHKRARGEGSDGSVLGPPEA